MIRPAGIVPTVIIDTNVVIAGLPTANGAGPFAVILNGMLHADFAFAVSDALLAEYRDVLSRPELRARLQLDETQVESMVSTLARQAIAVEPVPAQRAPDPDDQFLWELLAARDDLQLVTRDKLLLGSSKMRGRVIPPEVFVERMSLRRLPSSSRAVPSMPACPGRATR